VDPDVAGGGAGFKTYDSVAASSPMTIASMVALKDGSWSLLQQYSIRILGDTTRHNHAFTGERISAVIHTRAAPHHVRVIR